MAKAKTKSTPDQSSTSAGTSSLERNLRNIGYSASLTMAHLFTYGQPMDVLRNKVQAESVTMRGAIGQAMRQGAAGAMRVAYNGIWMNAGKLLGQRAIRTPLMVEVPAGVDRILPDSSHRARAAAQGLLSAAFIAGIDTLFITPFDNIRLHTQREKFAGRHVSSLQAARTLGMSAITRGAMPAFAKGWTAWSNFFLFYEGSKAYASKHGRDAPSLTDSMVAGIASAGSKVLITNPWDVIKTRQQSQCGTAAVPYRQIVKQLWSEAGLAAFYRGMLPRMVHGAGNALIGMMVMAYNERQRQFSAKAEAAAQWHGEPETLPPPKIEAEEVTPTTKRELVGKDGRA